MTTRTDERLQTLGYLLVDGLTYEWFQVAELDEKACTAVIYTDVDDEGTFDKRHEIGPDDIARGLRMYREWLEGTREGFPGEWRYKARDEIRAGRIENESDFDPVKWREASGVRQSYAWQTVIFDRTNGEEGDYDANTADNVLQFAIFGEVIFG
ncbi:hypothetical protein PBI_JOSHKAYV_90 [Mycobacterium phage JoshKayV]|uniref:Uncharacterized protein n=1 Tax=Mycobacterium phage JoshKayV TaxID=2024294 RepID=A0A249XTV9_9CAUD|nr:hypothetical protein KIY86_gp17 [Mycobacterium phage JoshKayV]ASZ75429.1 hypothetical protein PBI_JOSHKAYV_90 [Mycobacterium phage JoshKayV]